MSGVGRCISRLRVNAGAGAGASQGIISARTSCWSNGGSHLEGLGNSRHATRHRTIDSHGPIVSSTNCARLCTLANAHKPNEETLTAWAVDITKSVRGGIILHEQALERAAPRATTSRVLEALEAACRALSSIFAGSSALGVIAAAAAALSRMWAFLTWLRLLNAYSVSKAVSVTVEVAESTTSVVLSTVTVAGNDVLERGSVHEIDSDGMSLITDVVWVTVS